MSFVRSFSQATVVAVAAMASAVSVQAATFAAPVELDFTLSETLLGFLGNSPVITTTGGATVSGSTITLPASTVTLGNANGSDLIAGTTAAFTVTTTSSSGVTSALNLSNLSYNNATKQLSATIKLNGATAFSGVALTTASAQLLESFNATLGTGLLHAMGINAFQQAFIKPTLLNTAFGKLSVDTVAAAVPEPSTYALMGIGLVGIGLMARKKKQA